MAENHHESTNKLPPGWDCKYDVATGKCYYFNYLTKAMSLEDPRIRLRQLQNERTEGIAMQPMHGSPYHVYPTNNYPAVQAFQGPSNGAIYNVSSTASPNIAPKFQQQQMEMSPILRQSNTNSPLTARIVSQMAKHQQQLAQEKQQETSFITATETDAAVYKINTMFPTASESHIRLLLKKYYNREAVVISALQVEKHPLTTPGPYATPPPPGYHAKVLAAAQAFGMGIHGTPPLGVVSRTGSPTMRPNSGASGNYGSPRVGESYRSSPKPHSSPKMKLRYLKSIFPKADETLLLDILANADNNVQIASEKLLSMGYEKRDNTAPKLTNRNREEQVMRDRKIAELTPPPVPKIKTNDEKIKIKAQLQQQYKDVPGRIITMALESVDYSEDRAGQILNIVQQDDKNEQKTKTTNSVSTTANTSVDSVANNYAQKMANTTPLPQEAVTSVAATVVSTVVVHSSTEDATKTLEISSNKMSPETSLLSSSSNHVNSFPSDQTSSSSTSCSSSTLRAADTIDGLMEVGRKSTRNRSKAKSDHRPKSTTALVDKVDQSKVISTIATTGSGSVKKKTTSTGAPQQFKSILGHVNNTGANKELYKGPNEELLLVDYIAWNGANPDFHASGQTKLACGPNASLMAATKNRTKTNGPNAELYKGASIDLAKGSIYAQMTNVRCN